MKTKQWCKGAIHNILMIVRGERGAAAAEGEQFLLYLLYEDYFSLAAPQKIHFSMSSWPSLLTIWRTPKSWPRYVWDFCFFKPKPQPLDLKRMLPTPPDTPRVPPEPVHALSIYLFISLHCRGTWRFILIQVCFISGLFQWTISCSLVSFYDGVGSGHCSSRCCKGIRSICCSQEQRWSN